MIYPVSMEKGRTVLAALALSVVMVAASAVVAIAGVADVPLRVMPLGDSITFGAQSLTQRGYRGPLYDQLAAHGGQVEFVGSLRSGPAPSAHEGHSGWVISQIAGIANDAIATYRPNVVLLHIGTNDMNNAVDPPGSTAAQARLGNLIDQILAADPQLTLVVSTIVLSNISTTQERIKDYNEAIPGLVAARRAAGKKIALVDMGALTSTDLDHDDLHPNDSGYAKMATAFHGGIVAAADAGWITPPIGGFGAVGPPRTWVSAGTVATGTGSAAQILFADIDGDRRADYLKVGADSSVQAWLYGGGTTWFPQGTIASGVGVPGSQIRFADISGDGKAD